MKQTYITTQILLAVLPKASKKNKMVHSETRVPIVAEAIKNQLIDVHQELSRLN